MVQNLKNLVAVLVLSLIMWSILGLFSKNIGATAEADMKRRRMAWFMLTTLQFILPSFWLFLIPAVPLLYWAGKRDSNPMALVLLMAHVIPPFVIEIPAIAVNRFFDLNNYRILALTICLPWVIRNFQMPRFSQNKAARIGAYSLFGFLILQWIVLIPYESFTNTLRRGFLIYIDVFIIFVVLIGSVKTRRQINDLLLMALFGIVLMAPTGLFENLAGYFLFTGVADIWGGFGLSYYLTRGDWLRAQSSAGHSLALGVMLAMAVGMIFYFWKESRRAWVSILLLAVTCGALIATISRGPWLVAIIITLMYLPYVRTKPNVLEKLIPGTVLAGAILMLTPIGTVILENLPFAAPTTGEDTIEYRQRLAEAAWDLVKVNPLLGNPHVLSQMEHLRQGEGIIDLVNSFASTALFYGLIGLALFVLPFVLGIVAIHATARLLPQDSSLRRLGYLVVAIMNGILVMLAVGSFGTGLAFYYWVFCAIPVAYVAIVFPEGQQARQASAKLSRA